MHVFTPFFTPVFPALAGVLIPIFIAAALWTIILKGFALWYAARGSQKWWFVALLIINTLGILEIVYLIWFRPKSERMHESAPVHPSSPA